MLKIGILSSTNGTDMQAVIDNIEAGRLHAKISVVISNKKDCGAMQRAKRHRLNHVFVDPEGKSREEFDENVSKIIEDNDVELIILIGYMRYLGKSFVDRYANRIMNIHPSLLPAFAGGMDKDVHQEILDWGVKLTGCTLHFVDEGADTGPIILQKAVEVKENETVDSLRRKVQMAEQETILKGIKLFAGRKLQLAGRKVRILE